LCTEGVIAIEDVHLMTQPHQPIDIRRVGPDGREFLRMIGSEVTDRVGCSGVTGERRGQRQPPKSSSRRAQLAHGSFIHAERAARAGVPLMLRMHEGYDHSYFFISTFIENHLRWHAQRLGIASA
jgi:hypothetical protein